jgi:4-amino-4-deoxy-L-arabinose transferase-like glycosyltransferase
MPGLPRSPWLAVGLALTLRLAVIVWASGGASPQAFEYDTMATNLLEGRGYTFGHLGIQYRSLHSAVPYVFLNAVVCGVTGHRHTVLVLTQSLLGALLVLVVFHIGRLIFSVDTAAIAALLLAMHPGLIVYDTLKLHPLSLDALSIAASVLAVISLDAGSPWWRRMGTGGVIGLALLERGTFILFALGAPFVAARALGLSLRAAVRFSAPLLLGVALLLGPLVIRNVLIHGVPVVMTTSGEHFWRGNHPGATGTSYTRDGQTVFNAADPAFRATVLALDEIGQMRAFAAAGREFWANSPGEAVGLYAKRVLYFFSMTPTTGLLYPPWYRRLYLLYYVVCAGAAVLGARSLVWHRGHPDRPTLLRVLLLACIVSVGLVQSVFYVETRHRWGVEPLILLLTAEAFRKAFGGSAPPR